MERLLSTGRTPEQKSGSVCVQRAFLYTIGIDGGKNTGVAVFSKRDQKFLSIQTLDFWRTFELITTGFKPDQAEILIEDPSSQSAVFRRKGRVNYQNRLAQNIGSVKRETALLAEGLERRGFSVRMIPIDRRPKWDAGFFRRITKYEGRTSQHGRDSARLVLEHANTNRPRDPRSFV